MSSPHRSLAARFRTAVRTQREHDDDSASQQHDLQEAAQRSREALMDELEDFAELAEFFTIARAEMSLLLRYEGRRLRFDCDRREPIIHLRSSQLRADSCLRYHPTRRIWQVHLGGARRLGATVDLFPHGLERLITQVFDIRPSAAPPPKEAPVEPTPEELVQPASRFWRAP